MATAGGLYSVENFVATVVWSIQRRKLYGNTYFVCTAHSAVW